MSWNVITIPQCVSAEWPTDGLQVILVAGKRGATAVRFSGMGLVSMRPESCLSFAMNANLASISQPKEWRWPGFKGFTCHLPFPGPYFDWNLSTSNTRAKARREKVIYRTGKYFFVNWMFKSERKRRIISFSLFIYLFILFH